ncbi:MAG: GC-type dockerin domain-anchored protein [Phycisphaerales bacterium JB060]
MKNRARKVGFLFGCVLASAAAADDITMSQTVSDEVVLGFGQVCPSLGTAATVEASSYWRSFDLRAQGVSQDLRVTSVQFGIETLRLPTLAEVDITVNLYNAPEGTPPQTGLPLIGSAVATVGEVSGGVVSVDVDAIAAAGSALVVEVSVPSLRDLAGGEFGESFLPGANGFGESEPVYFASEACGIAEPQPWNPDWGTFNYVLTVSGGAFCATDLDGDGELTVFDFLTFQNFFDARDPRADLDGDGAFTIFDFLEFQNRFTIGC